MIETFQAVVFGLANGRWSIVDQRLVEQCSEAFEWARRRVTAIALAGGYQRLRARVISSADEEESAESVLRELNRGRGAGIMPERAPRYLRK